MITALLMVGAYVAGFITPGLILAWHMRDWDSPAPQPPSKQQQ